METPQFTAYTLLMPWLRSAPPWVVLSALGGVVSASAFYLFASRGFRSLPIYLALGLMVAPLTQYGGFLLALTPGPLTVGEVDLVLVALGTWALLAIARLLRL